jgi:hypothetical protein
MPVQRKSTQPGGITGANGQPHLELDIDGLKISSTPPAKGTVPPKAAGAAAPDDDAPTHDDVPASDD